MITGACACADEHTETFFPVSADDYAKPRSICDGCAVRRECLEEEMRIEAHKIPYLRAGMYGGLTPAQRYSLERRGVNLRCDCGELRDPIDLRAGDLQCAWCPSTGYMEPIPDKGDRR